MNTRNLPFWPQRLKITYFKCMSLILNHSTEGNRSLYISSLARNNVVLKSVFHLASFKKKKPDYSTFPICINVPVLVTYVNLMTHISNAMTPFLESGHGKSALFSSCDLIIIMCRSKVLQRPSFQGKQPQPMQSLLYIQALQTSQRS